MTDDIQDVILLSHFISSDASWHHHPIGHKTGLLTVHKVIVRYTDHLQVLKVTSASLPSHKPQGPHTNHTKLIPMSPRVGMGSTHQCIYFFLYLSGGGILSVLFLLLPLVCRMCLRRKESTIKP